ncbi:uncharacterized protein TNCV_1243811 [Trichonephila clavipes]|nr:uncharacterized protein TNCV_1243811 [Trichonephila clavipes]
MWEVGKKHRPLSDQSVYLPHNEKTQIQLIIVRECLDANRESGATTTSQAELLRITCRSVHVSQALAQDALFICCEQSPDNAHSVAFSQRSSSPRLIEDETFNDSDIINNLIDYEDRQEEPDSLREDKNMQGSSFPKNLKSIFLKLIPIPKGV